ncbi:MAG: hypothetical protein JSR86_01960 [Proteobacteria bacterium]|nr:hypothetical protein [Pseudomonadota bacterium]
MPPAHDAGNWRLLMTWLGPQGRRLDQPGAVEVDTPNGARIALPGDWIVLSVSGDYHIAGAAGRWGAA